MIFTLIELLVVVAIMSILMCLLLPALGMARKSVGRTQCANNLKQMGVSVFSYIGDYDGWCPAARPGGGAWYNLFLDLEYLRNSSVYKCPSEPADFDLNYKKMPYGINYSTFGTKMSSSATSPKKESAVSRFGRNSKLIVIGDSVPLAYASVGVGITSDNSDLIGIAGGAYPVDNGYCPVFLRHLSAANGLMFDGHTASLKYECFSTSKDECWYPTQSGASLCAP
jgi:prepilin-type N-terminal cleavage/methylation domain-containing protein/prepilin-type processing-associated H-X9-DG protein